MTTNSSNNVYIAHAPETTRDKIRRFGSLQEGWHYGEGTNFPTVVLELALGLEAFARDQGFMKTDAFPGTAGEVRITLYEGHTYLEFTIETDSSVTYVREKDSAELEYREHMSIEDAKTAITTYWNEKCDLSESSIPIISIRASRDRRASNLNPPLEMVEYQWLSSSASGDEGKYSVTTSESSIAPTLSASLHFGNSIHPSFPIHIS